MRKFFKRCKYVRALYNDYKIKRKEWINRCQYKFINRSDNRAKMCYILAGYKPFLFDVVFGRISQFVDDDIDVCVVSSGMYSQELFDICKNNNWSYLSIQKNNVSLAQNTVIRLHPFAKYLYKLDEDIFVTNGYFKKMFLNYECIVKDSDYIPGFISPLIPINGYCYLRVLDKLHLREYYSKTFERPHHAAGREYMIENNLKVAKFFWDGEKVPSIDEMNYKFERDKGGYSAAPVRVSIGAIFFTKDLWEDMGWLTVHRGTNDMGTDEEELCTYCMSKSKAVLVMENTLVGHLSFGTQNRGMEEYFKANKDKFYIGVNSESIS